MKRRRSLGVLVLSTGLLMVGMVPAAQAAPECFNRQATFVGTNAGGFFPGTPGNDVAVLKGGDDFADGQGGFDRLCGNAGDDFLRGQEGEDRLAGGDGGDFLDAGDIIAVFFEEASPDSSDNRLLGGDGADSLFGAAGDDELSGGGGVDQIFDGGDFGGGNNKLNGGRGDDFINSANGSVDVVDGGPGEDECITDPQDSVENCEFGDNNRGEGLSAKGRDDIRERFDDAVERLKDLGR